MSLANVLSSPLFTGTASSDDTRWDVSIGGHGYQIDMKYIGDFGRQTVPMIRTQSDTSDKPGEASLNPAGLWRRSVESWHKGAGQMWLDKPDSDPFRFNTSKGVDPWTKYGIGLLNGTANVSAVVGTNQYLTQAGASLYHSNGNNVRYTPANSTASFTNATGTPAPAVTSLTSDGNTVYAAFGTSGIYTTTGTVFASYVTGTVGLVRYVKGRLMAAQGPALYNVTAAGALPVALYTHPNASWTWTDVTAGQNVIYISGTNQGVSIIYKTTVKPDGTALDIPTVAVELPQGESALSITGYLGFVVIGTDQGVRFAVADSNGNLTLGSIIRTNTSVLAAEGQDRFIWFGWNNYDATSTGLGRLDLTAFTSDLTPAYATDLMATGQGSVQSVVTYLDKRIFTVNGLGVFEEQATKVASGTVTSGRITYGIPDTKTAVNIDVRHDPLPAAAAVTLSLALDAGTPTVLGTSELDGASVSSPEAFVINQSRGTFFEITATLSGSLTLRRVTLRADPAAERTVMFQAPLLFHDTLDLPGQVSQPFDIDAEFQYLADLTTSRQVVNYQEAGETYRVVCEDYIWRPYERTDRYWTGTFLIKMKEL